MEITDVRIRRISYNHADDNKMRAVVSITFDDVFVVHDIKIIQGTKKLFIEMPSRKISDGTFKDTAHPIKPSFRGKIQDAIIARYEKALTENEYNFQVGSVNNVGTRKEKKE